jgi:catechol 2,3-dioxygenase-like lactoylglutathione lyase family enzyme
LKLDSAFSSYSVDDLEKAERFYRETLGVEVRRQKPEGNEIQLGGRGNVFLYPKPNHSPATFIVLNFIVDDVDRIVAELNRSGISMERYDQGALKTDAKGIARGEAGQPGPRAMAWFKDPAGNILSIVQPN